MPCPPPELTHSCPSVTKAGNSDSPSAYMFPFSISKLQSLRARSRLSRVDVPYCNVRSLHFSTFPSPVSALIPVIILHISVKHSVPAPTQASGHLPYQHSSLPNFCFKHKLMAATSQKLLQTLRPSREVVRFSSFGILTFVMQLRPRRLELVSAKMTHFL
jgi:hypothetical protein